VHEESTPTTYTARATRWRHGWELAVDGYTQSHTLAEAERQVRDYVATVYDLTDADADAHHRD
jgi:hypothetical protein